jgi:hypothetical protein
MKRMTTAEFGKSNLADLTEPVEVRRYTTVVGTFYPATGAVLPPADPDLIGTEYGPSQTQKRIKELEEEVKHLKKALAAKMEMSQAVSADGETQRTPSRTVVALEHAADVERRVSGLHQQDLDYINRKLGKK